jgi:hypothetical protein
VAAGAAVVRVGVEIDAVVSAAGFVAGAAGDAIATGSADLAGGGTVFAACAAGLTALDAVVVTRIVGAALGCFAGAEWRVDALTGFVAGARAGFAGTRTGAARCVSAAVDRVAGIGRAWFAVIAIDRLVDAVPGDIAKDVVPDQAVAVAGSAIGLL